MKTAVSIPDEIFRRADKLARRQKKSRSQLYRDAVCEYIARHDDDGITESWNRVIAEVGNEPDRFVTEAARRVLENTEW